MDEPTVETPPAPANRKKRVSDTAAAESLSAALVAAQGEMPSVAKDATNPHFKSKFVSLDSLIEKTRPVLNAHGLALVQFPAVSDIGQPVLRTILVHGATGEQLQADMPLMVAGQTMQQFGAAITYARRYAWAAVLGVASEEDDDGNAAAQAKNTKPGMISEAQRRRLFAIASEANVSTDLLRNIIAGVTGDPEGSTQTIPVERYDDLVALVEAEDVPF